MRSRLRFNFLNGSLSQGLSEGATVLHSSALTLLPSINDPDYVAIVLDPAKQQGPPEIIHIVEYVQGNTSATVERGKEGTSARSHSHQTSWIHGLLVEDFSYIQGPEGPPGANFTYRHEQETPEQIWVIEHNLSGYPNVAVVDSAGSTVEGAIRYDSDNVITIEFTSAFSGSAYLS